MCGDLPKLPVNENKVERGSSSGGVDCSVVIDQELIMRILKRAESLPMGIEEIPKNVRSLSDYNPSDDSFALAMILVGMFHDKYDLVAVFQAMFDEISLLPNS